MNISRRLNQVPASPIRKLVPLADAAKKRGTHVIHLNIGDPDIETPRVMTDRLRQWQGGIPYAHSQGDAELIAALLKYYRGLGADYLKAENIQVTVGGSEALTMAMAAVADPGEEILVFEPFFPSYHSLAVVQGLKVVPVTTSIADGFHLPKLEQFEALVTPKTRAILLTNPNNPTGTVYRREEVDGLVELVRRKGLFLLADEVYREIVFDGQPSTSLLSYLKVEPDRLVILDSLSKRYSAPGLRLGMMVSLNQDLMAGGLRIAMARLSAGYIDQKAAAGLSQVSQADLAAVRDEHQRRRDVVFAGLKSIKGVTIHQPEGAFYCVVGLPVAEAERFCAWLLSDFSYHGATVMLAPMAGFYLTPGLGKQEVRWAYVVGETKLKQAIEIIGKALATYPESRY